MKKDERLDHLLLERGFRAMEAEDACSKLAACLLAIARIEAKLENKKLSASELREAAFKNARTHVLVEIAKALKVKR